MHNIQKEGIFLYYKDNVFSIDVVSCSTHTCVCRILEDPGFWLWDEAPRSCDPAGGLGVLVFQQSSSQCVSGRAGIPWAKVSYDERLENYE